MMEWLNIAGLVLNIFGVILLAKYPIDPGSPKEDGSFTMTVNPGSSATHSELVRYWDHMNHTKLGFVLIGLGFFVQLIASWP